MEADINFRIEDYEEDLKQVCVMYVCVRERERERFVIILNYVILNSATLSSTVSISDCRIAFSFFIWVLKYMSTNRRTCNGVVSCL